MNPADNDEVDIDELEKLLLAADTDVEIIGLEISDNNSTSNGTTYNHLPQVNDGMSNKLIPTSTNGFSDVLNKSIEKKISEKSAVHTEERDSSDDEDTKNFLEQKYNEYGRDIRSLIKNKIDDNIDKEIDRAVSNSIRERGRTAGAQQKQHEFPVFPPVDAKPKILDNVSIYTDPIFGIRIIHPLISSTSMAERMAGRTPVSTSGIPHHLKNGDLSKDWAIAGVIIKKGVMATSKKGSQYTIWKLSDLKGDIKTVSIFLFKTACSTLWKTSIGTVVAILNPAVLDNNNSRDDIASLSVDKPNKFMILGQSKDFGSCKSRKKNGEICNAAVNMKTCEYCVYHVKQEYGKMSGRSELQSATSGRGLQNLRNKVLGKSEVFYGGQSYVAIPAKKNPKLAAKDQKRLLTLSEYYKSPHQEQGETSAKNKTVNYASSANFVSKVAAGVESNVKQRQKDLERLKLLTGGNSVSPAQPILANEVQTAITIEQFKNREFSSSLKAPQIKKEGFSFESNVMLKKSEFSKSKAIEILKKNPIKKSNPNFIKHRGTESGKKRALADINTHKDNQAKKQKITEEAEQFQTERIQKIIEINSSHVDLITNHKNEAQENYFNKLEKKEAMEEKMLNTFQIDCKAVVCLKCRYTAFSASDRCKDEGHPIKVIDAQKRFFECQDCGNRTATVHRIPQMSCKNCQSSRWMRTAMIKDRKNERVGEQLSLRGDEETFIGSLATKGNINLCVGDE